MNMPKDMVVGFAILFIFINILIGIFIFTKPRYLRDLEENNEREKTINDD